jgi:glycosyltransferase involved in cell wall biosynthesis
VILGVDGQARQIIEDAGAGIVIEPENAAALVAAISQLSSNPELGTAMGQEGREHILRNFSRRSTAEKYVTLLESLVPESLAGNHGRSTDSRSD